MSKKLVLPLVVAACAGTAWSAPMDTPAALSGPEALFQRTVAREMMRMLPREQQQQIREAGGVGSENEPYPGQGVLVLDDRYEKIAGWVSPESYAVIADKHLDLLTAMSERMNAGERVPAMCFAEGTPWETVEAFDLAYRAQQSRFQQTGRWSFTATDGNTGGQGDPITLTYSFVPDGTFCPNIIGVTGNSQLFAWMNGLYGSPATWQPLFAQIFDRWSQLIGVDYVYEPNDDGSNLNGASGSIGVRGDLRIAAIHIDGNSGVLAYNNFPNDGDMVLDAYDSFFSSTSANSRRLRNVAAHEHGHGLGMLHVCPANGTKLMEPYVTTSYDGPQIDDILNGQRHYGDPYEPSNNAAQATTLGTLNVGTLSGTPIVVSIDDNSDVDYYSFNFTLPSLRIIATATPAAAAYQQGAQTSACNTGTFTDYNDIHDLKIELLDTNGTSVLATANSSPQGSAETLDYSLPAPGTYYLRVSGDTSNDIQAYLLSVEGQAAGFIPMQLSLPSTPTDVFDPGVPTSFDVTVALNDDTFVGQPSLFYRYDGGAYQSVALTHVSGDQYEATVPAGYCGDHAEFYVRAEGQAAGVKYEPNTAPATPFMASVGIQDWVLQDDFETSAGGWSIGGTISSTSAGRWERGTPIGVGSTGAPFSDADGSGQCYLTGNSAGADVDGGTTVLTSSTFDLSSQPDATFSYWRWFNNNGANEEFKVQISETSGATWTTVETIGPGNPDAAGGWVFKEFRVDDFVTPNSVNRVRFFAQDTVGGTIEAAVDGFAIGTDNCVNPPSCACDLDVNSTLNIDDINLFAAAFVGGDLAADLDGNGTLNLDDINAFAQCFVGGCP